MLATNKCWWYTVSPMGRTDEAYLFDQNVSGCDGRSDCHKYWVAWSERGEQPDKGPASGTARRHAERQSFRSKSPEKFERRLTK